MILFLAVCLLTPDTDGRNWAASEEEVRVDGDGQESDCPTGVDQALQVYRVLRGSEATAPGESHSPIEAVPIVPAQRMTFARPVEI